MKWLRLLCLACCLVVVLSPAVAYADYDGGAGGSHNVDGEDLTGGGGASHDIDEDTWFGTCWYGPEINDNVHIEGYVASNPWNAALYMLNFPNSYILSNITNSVKQKLSTAETGGAFWSLAQRVTNTDPSSDDETSVNQNYALIASYNYAKVLYGQKYSYWCSFTNEEAARARQTVLDVVAGNGASDPVIAGEAWKNGSNYYVPVVEWDTGLGGTSTKKIECLEVPQSYFNSVKADADANGWTIYGFVANGYYDLNGINSQDMYFCAWLFACDPDNIVFNDSYTISFNEAFETYTVFDFYNDSRYSSEVKSVDTGRGTKYCLHVNDTAKRRTFQQGLWCQPTSSSTDGVRDQWVFQPIYYASTIGSIGGVGGGGDEPDPPTGWEPDPVKPDPPEVPDPPEPDPPTPYDPTEPVHGNPWIPIPEEDITITGEDFQDLLDALNEHCLHLQASIQSNIEQLWDLQSELLDSQLTAIHTDLNGSIEWLGNDVILAGLNDLEDYLHELFEWLSEQLNFDVTSGGGYDDTSVVQWLKQIWAKMPTGVNTRPSDPVTEPKKWWDWLTQLLNNLAADLMALGHDKLANVLEMLNNLRNKFPFSLPWDMAALLGMLVAVPECPEFDVPAYALGSNLELTEVGSYHITLEPYEDVWEGVKWIETLAFAVYLITHTGGLMDMVTKTVRPR